MVNVNTGFLDKYCVDIMFGIPIIEYGPGNKFNQTKKESSNPDKFAGQVIEVRYSNPVKDELFLHYNLSNDAIVSISLFDIAGNRVMSRGEVNETGGDHDITLSTVSLIPGMYALHLVVGDQRIVKTILITQ